MEIPFYPDDADQKIIRTIAGNALGLRLRSAYAFAGVDADAAAEASLAITCSRGP